MRNILRRIYEWFTRPLYQRLIRDITLELQRQQLAVTELHENCFKIVLDELMAVTTQLEMHKSNLEAAGLLTADSTCLLSEASLTQLQIAQIVQESFDKDRTFDEIAKAYDISPGTVAVLQAKYFGLDYSAIGRMRAVLEQNESLKRENLLLMKMTSRGEAIDFGASVEDRTMNGTHSPSNPASKPKIHDE